MKAETEVKSNKKHPELLYKTIKIIVKKIYDIYIIMDKRIATLQESFYT